MVIPCLWSYHAYLLCNCIVDNTSVCREQIINVKTKGYVDETCLK